jgi:hypothetical protein
VKAVVIGHAGELGKLQEGQSFGTRLSQ